MTKISFSIAPTQEDSLALIRLQELISGNSTLKVNVESEKIEGAKGDLANTLEVIGVVFTGISTLIDIIEFWQSQYPKYSVTMKLGDDTFSKEDISKEEFEKDLIEAKNKQEQMHITISSK
jgi:hypothetical protein